MATIIMATPYYISGTLCAWSHSTLRTNLQAQCYHYYFHSAAEKLKVNVIK